MHITQEDLSQILFSVVCELQADNEMVKLLHQILIEATPTFNEFCSHVIVIFSNPVRIKEQRQATNKMPLRKLILFTVHV